MQILVKIQDIFPQKKNKLKLIKLIYLFYLFMN